ncbi:MAG: hypothetical protein EBR82_34585, partial [Caulobacteraceae bacterium]|nr:hypothetical protein [Caulobacteraceae bacterium]
VFEPNQIKSAAPVTYDYRGNIIPPSQRFKAETPDIRYQTGYHAARGLFEPEPGFPNGRFRLDKIGTGLGGQAYGWGIYLAPERPGASSYYDALKAESPTAVLYELDVPDDIVGKLLDFGKPIPIKLRVAVNRELKAQGVDLEIDASISLGEAIEQIQDAAFPDSEDYAKLTSELLDRAGIPGLQVSAYGEKRPYVIWNQDALDRVALLKANEKTLGEIGKTPSPLGSIVSIETENGADYWYAPPEETPQGLITFLDREDKRMATGVLAVIRGFSAANVSTPIHEMFHFYRRFLLNEENGFTAAEIKAFEDWAGAKDGVWSVEADEKAARGFEKYLRTGVAPLESLKKLFARIAEWMRGVYKTLDGSAIDIDITPEARRVYDRIFTLQAERQLRPDTKVSKVQRGSTTLYQTEITPKEGPVYTDNILEAMKKWSPKGTVEQLKAHLGKFKGAIAEANWIGLPVFLEGRDRVTRAEVEQFVKDNEISIQEVLLGQPGAPSESRARFGAYTLEPSGENYRELLLTIKPQSPRLIQTATGQRVYEPSAQRLSPTMDAVAAERELARLLSVPTPTFVQPGHYPTPNIVVHVRFNERTMADGNKVLFLEEIQSDWAQAWRQRRASSTATPFEDTPVWTALAFKRMLRWATDIGFDKIAWTTGRIQARRWHQTVTVPDIPRTGIESIEFTKAQRFLSTDTEAWDLTVRLLDGKEERYQDITTNTLKEEFGTAIANEIVRVARSVPGGMRPGRRHTISPSPSGRQKAAKVRVSQVVREEEVRFAGSNDTWLVSRLVVTETGLDGRVTTIEFDRSSDAADYFGNTLYERILAQPAFDDYYEAVLRARAQGRPEPPAPELVLSQEDLASIETAQQATQPTSQIANAMMTYYDTIIPKEVKKLVKPFGGTVTTERLESGQTVHTVSVTDKMKAQARQGQVLFQREGEGVPKEQTATEAYRKYQQEQRQKNVQAAFARLRQQATAAKPEETKTKAKPEAAKAQAEPSKAKKAPAAPSGQPRQPRAASTEAKRGFGDKTLTEVFDKLVKDVKAGTIPRQTTPATDTERLEERIQRSLRDIVIAAYGTKVIPEDIAAQAKDLADAMLAAQAKGDTETFDAAEQAFKTLTAGARRASRPQPPPRPAKTVAERLDDAVKRAEKPSVSGVTSPEVFAQEEIGRRARKFQEFIKKAMQQNSAAKPYLDEVTINGQTRSRRDLFLLGAEEYEKGVVENNPLLKQQGDDKMRAAIDSIAAALTDIKRPQWHNLRSPLSYANVIGSYEAIMGPLGKEISDLFKLFHSAVARGELGFGEALRGLEVRLNKAYVPLMIAQGYLGMPSVIKEHVAFIRKTAALSARMTQVKQAGSVFKEPAAWFAARRDLVQDFGYAPLAALMLKSAVYNTKLRFNVKSAATNFFQLALSAGPYLTPDEFVKIINDSLKPSTWKREVAPGMTLRDVAIGETGGRRVEGAPDLSAQSKWWHRIDVFQLSSDHVRVAAYLVGELMAERYSAQQEASGRPALAASTKSRMIRDWVEKVEFDNSPWNRAPLFRGSVADILFQFKPFLQKNVERMIADLQRNPEGFVVRPAKTPVGKLVEVALPQGARRVVKLLAAQVTLGGVSSLLTAIPGLKAMGGILLLAGLINMFKSAGMDDDEAEELAVGLYYGAPAALGIDLSSTVGFFDEPFGKEVYEQVVSYFLGPSVSTGLNVYKRFQEYTKAAQEAPKLGREEAKAKEVQERLLKIPAAVTPYVRMYNAAKDMVTGQPTTIRLQEEVRLSRKEQIIQALGGSPIQQTMFFDNKEAYGWQNRLMGRPTGYERVKPKPGESNDAYFKRAAVAEKLTSQYLPELQRNPQFRQMSPADQEAVLDNLSRNITEESGKARPDRRKLRARLLVRNRRQTMREQRRNALRNAQPVRLTR